ncbi:EpsG family protein [Myroides odoratimimus]|uniref:EpsG family protein n=1 Tax=Myroides odoratimimus TaxID=76832 RepID=UPI003D2F60BD
MWVYYFIFLTSFLFCSFDFSPRNSTFNKCVFYLFTTILVLIVGFRAVGIDNDSYNYLTMFEMYSTFSISDILDSVKSFSDVGYVFINNIVYRLGGDFEVVMLFTALISGGFTYYFLIKRSELVFLSLLFYLSFFILYRDFTQIRYAIAASICFWVVDKYLKRSFGKCLILFLVAISFHKAAIVILPILVFVYYINNAKIYLILPFLGFLIGKSINVLSYFLIFDYSSDHMSIYDNKTSGGGSWSITLFSYIVVLTIYLLQKENLTKKYYIYSCWKIVALSAFINSVVIEVSIFQRFSYISFQFLVIVLPIFVLSFKHLLNNRWYIVYFITSIFLLYYGFNMIDNSLIRPYF